jgi:hypothetical protein
MPASGILIEAVDSAAPLELVELVAADGLSDRAVSAVPNDGVGARVVLQQSSSATRTSRSPMMVVVVGDLRGGRQGEPLSIIRSSSALSVAVVTVDSLAPTATAYLERAFDCVVPVLARHGTDAEYALTNAVSAVTAFATANRISIPVDEVYPLFARAGRATWGAAADTNIVAAAERAFAGAGVASKRGPQHALLHVESSERDYMNDLRLASEVAWRTPNLKRLELVASARGASVKRVSVVAVACR